MIRRLMLATMMIEDARRTDGGPGSVRVAQLRAPGLGRSSISDDPLAAIVSVAAWVGAQLSRMGF